MINGSPEVVRFPVDLDENLVQMPLPVRIATHPARPFPTNLGCEQRAKSVPPEPDCLVTDIDPAFVEQIFHVPQR